MTPAQARLPWRIAVVSDPHGDLIALEKVIEDLGSVPDVDEVLFGGDLAQSGAQPVVVIDLIRSRGWQSVRGNADDLLVRVADGIAADQALRIAEATHGSLPKDMAARADWSVRRLGTERIDYLRSLPMSIVRGPFGFGNVVLEHATPWSTEEVVLPDAGEDVARRMVSEAHARLLLYGHIHTPYQRRAGDATLASVGAVSGSNDADPRPAYTIVDLDPAFIKVEVRRVEWPRDERLEAYRRAGVEQRWVRVEPGPLPVRSQAGVTITVWP